jgi:hypothetical protein
MDENQINGIIAVAIGFFIYFSFKSYLAFKEHKDASKHATLTSVYRDIIVDWGKYVKLKRLKNEKVDATLILNVISFDSNQYLYNLNMGYEQLTELLIELRVENVITANEFHAYNEKLDLKFK